MDASSLITRIKTSVTTKVLFILFMTLLLMIPNFMIKDLIRERSGRKIGIEREVARSYGKEQKVMVPILRIPYVKTIVADDGAISYSRGNMNYSPSSSSINGEVATSTRKRSIYEIVVYNTQLDMEQSFDISNFDVQQYPNYKLDYTQAHFIYGISDANGLYEDSDILINGKAIKMKGLYPASNNMNWVESMPFSLDPLKPFQVSYSLKLKGTKSLSFEPIGDNYKVKLNSPWQAPSFVGAKLPTKYDITDEGFESTWSVNKFAHDHPHHALYDSAMLTANNSFGVNLILPVDEYGKNSRTAKYALLIISLTFGIFFFFEILYKKLIHPIQYLLVGFALTVFFLLLLSITEHLGFNLSYLISSIATVGLIVSYASYILENRKSTVILLGLLTGLFSYIFIILQMEDFALLAGAVALFVVLASVMHISRGINWYQLSKA